MSKKKQCSTHSEVKGKRKGALEGEERRVFIYECTRGNRARKRKKQESFFICIREPLASGFKMSALQPLHPRINVSDYVGLDILERLEI